MKDKKKKGWSKVGLIFLILVTLIFSGLAIAYSRTDLAQAASKYEENRVAAKKAGLFFTQSELHASFKVSPDDNGADLLKAIKHDKLGNPNSLTLAGLQAKSKEIAKAITQLESVTKRKKISSVEFFDGFASPDMGKNNALKYWVQFLVKAALLNAEQGNLQATQKYLSLAASLSNAADDESELISIFIRITTAAIIEANLRDLLQTHSQDPNWLVMMKGILKQLDQPYDLHQFAKCEHFSRVHYASILKQSPMPLRDAIEDKENPLPIRFSRFLPRFNEATLSRIHERYAGISARMPADPYDIEQLQKAVDYDNAFSARTGWSYAVANQYQSLLEGVVHATLKEIAQRNALLQAISILETKADPSKGLPLKGRYALDLDGKPLRLKRLDKGWILYSIWDGVDDGGTKLKSGFGDWIVHLSPTTLPPKELDKP